MSINPNYNSYCSYTARNCASGCCAYYGNCATSAATCIDQYDDYQTNNSYYYSGQSPNYNSNCNYDARNCMSGCCTLSGACATSSSTCTYRYSDYYSNYHYHYPVKYNSQCSSTAHNCVSGCCTSYGSCANTSSTCYYYYSDYSTNLNYYYPGNYNNYNYNYDSYNNNLTKKDYEKQLIVRIGISAGIVGFYLILYAIAAYVWYRYKKPYVEAINGIATHNQNGSPIVIDPYNPPKYAIDPECLKALTNPTYPGKSKTGNDQHPIDQSLNQINLQLARINPT